MLGPSTSQYAAFSQAAVTLSTEDSSQEERTAPPLVLVQRRSQKGKSFKLEGLNLFIDIKPCLDEYSAGQFSGN